MTKYDYSAIRKWTREMVNLYLEDDSLSGDKKLSFTARLLEQHSDGELRLTPRARKRIKEFVSSLRA